jgi:hypothetical protein
MSDDPEIKSNGTKLARSVIAEFQDKVTDISWGIFSIGFLASLLSVGYEIFAWLKNGEWPRLPFYAVFAWLNLDPFSPVNSIEWQGIKKILVWCLELPLSVGFLGLGAVLGGAFYAIFSRKD